MNNHKSGGLSLWEWLERKKDELYLNNIYEKPKNNHEDILVVETHPFALRIWTDFHLIHEEDSVFESIYSKRMKKKYSQINTVITSSLENDAKMQNSDDEDWEIINSQLLLKIHGNN